MVRTYHKINIENIHQLKLFLRFTSPFEIDLQEICFKRMSCQKIVFRYIPTTSTPFSISSGTPGDRFIRFTYTIRQYIDMS